MTFSRDLPPLNPGELGLTEVYLDCSPNPTVSIEMARRLLATTRHLERQLAQARRREDAAFALLEADLTPFPKAP